MVLSASCPINAKDCYYGSWIYTSPREGSTEKKQKKAFSGFWEWYFKNPSSQYALHILLKRANPLSFEAVNKLRMKRKVRRVKAKRGKTIEIFKKKKRNAISN
jgi:hypothetical protein